MFLNNIDPNKIICENKAGIFAYHLDKDAQLLIRLEWFVRFFWSSKVTNLASLCIDYFNEIEMVQFTIFRLL